MRFCRISFQMVAGGRVFDHPAARQRDYVLHKLIAFHHQHQTPPLQVQHDLQQASKQLPSAEHAAEDRAGRVADDASLVHDRLDEAACNDRVQQHPELAAR